MGFFFRHILSSTNTRYLSTTPIRFATPTSSSSSFPTLPPDHPFFQKLASHPQLINSIKEMTSLLTKRGIDVSTGQMPSYTTMAKLLMDGEVRQILEQVANEMRAAGLEDDVQEFAKTYAASMGGPFAGYSNFIGSGTTIERKKESELKKPEETKKIKEMEKSRIKEEVETPDVFLMPSVEKEQRGDKGNKLAGIEKIQQRVLPKKAEPAANVKLEEEVGKRVGVFAKVLGWFGLFGRKK
ncbi:hypothetical protein G9A89_014272 [Geosiphon pyriformis]|nr:hypothetical protein G9A89_014272 [Geosiphon pyriformis]